MSSDWPSPSDFLNAMQNPQWSFHDPKLRSAQVQKKKNGRPWPRGGAAATVYKLELAGGGATAVRVFHSPNAEREARYHALDTHLRKVALPCLVDFSYQRQGIQINATFYPILTMTWVEGDTLGVTVAKLAARQDAAALRALADRWVELMGSLRQNRIAHGDLQHGNVMVLNNQPILVDYDGMCVPDLVGQQAQEFGLPAYQHPGRSQCDKLSLDLDHFSAWMILISLRAAAADMALYKKYVTDTENETLLFMPEDISAPDKSELWKALAKSPDPEVREWSARVRQSISEPFDKIPPFQLDPFKSLRALVKKMPADWSAIATEAAKGSTSAQPMPTDLVGPVSEARRRVEALAKLEKAIATSDPRQIAGAFDPPQLANWPSVATQVQKAQKAVGQVKLLDALKDALKRGDHATFLPLWKKSATDLAAIAEAKTYQREAEKIDAQATQASKERAALDRLRAIVQADGPEKAIVEAWEEIESLRLSSHKDASGHSARASLARRRVERLAALASLSTATTEDVDLALVGIWDDALLNPCSEANPYRDRHREAVARLQSLKDLDRVVRGSDGSIVTDDAIVRTLAASGLHAGYSPRLDGPIQEAIVRQQARRKLAEAVRSDREEAIVEAWRDVQKVCPLHVEPADRKRAELARDRLDSLKKLKAIPTHLPAQEQDALWLNGWDKTLLDACQEAQSLQPRHKLAVRRTRIWSELEEALRDRVASDAKDLAGLPEIQDYPPFLVRYDEIQELIRVVGQIDEVRKALDSGDEAALARSFDLELIKAHEKDFASHRQPIERWVTKVLETSPLRASSRPALESAGTMPKLRILWEWPATPLVTSCRVAWGLQGYPRAGTTEVTARDVTKSGYERGGGHRITLPPRAIQAFVVVWPVVDLGWGKLSGKEVRLPPFNANGNGQWNARL